MASESSRPGPHPAPPPEHPPVEVIAAHVLSARRAPARLASIFCRPEHLDAAAAAVAQHLHCTPIVPLRFMRERRPDLACFAKLESRQIMGSFKTRGALARLAQPDLCQGQRSIVTAGPANHCLGFAWAASHLNIQATVVLEQDAPDSLRQRLKELVTLRDAPFEDPDETLRYARALARAHDACFVSYQSDPFVIAGSGGTIATELLASEPHCDAILCPIGSGALAAGLALALQRAGGSIPIIGVVAETNAAMLRSFEQGHAAIQPPRVPTLADALSGGVTPHTFAIARHAITELVPVSEEAIGEAMALIYREMGEVIEGSGAATVAALLGEPMRTSFQRPCLLFTGRNVDRDVLEAQLGPAGAIGRARR